MDKEFFVRETEAASGMLYRVAFTLLRNDDAVADALQSAILRAWEKRHTLREERYFRTWVTRILINTCKDVRREWSRTVALDDVPEPSAPPPDLTLHLALAKLPEKLRMPLVLVFSEGMTYQEAAQVLKLPVATVRGRIARAKQALRKELDAQ